MAEKDTEVADGVIRAEQKFSKVKELCIQLMRKACLSAVMKISRKELYTGADVIQLMETVVQSLESLMSEATCGDLEEEVDVLVEEAKLDENIPAIMSRSVFSNSKHEVATLKIEREKDFSILKFCSTSSQESDLTSKSRDFSPRPSTQNIDVEAAAAEEEIDVSGNTFSPPERLQSITKSIGCPKVESNQFNSSLNFEGREKIGSSDDDKEPLDDCVTNVSPEFRKIFLELDRMLAKRMNEMSLLSDLPEVSEERRGKYEDLAKEIHKSLHSESSESGEYRGYKYE